MKIVLTLLVFVAVLACVTHSMRRGRKGQLSPRSRGQGRFGDRELGARGRGRGRPNRLGPLGRRFKPRGGRQGFAFRRKFGLPRGAPEFSMWERDVNDTFSVKESAGVHRPAEVIVLKSKDMDLDDTDITPSVSYYDFKNRNVVVSTKVNDTRVCFLLPESALPVSFSETATEIIARNGRKDITTVDTASFIMKDEDKLSQTQRRNLRFDQNFPNRLCRGVVIDASVQLTGSPDPDTENVMILSIDGKTTIYLKSTLTL